MRIVTHLISLERLGGIEVNTLEDTCALASRGHEVHVLYGAPTQVESGPRIREELEKAGVILHGPFRFDSTLQGAAAATVRFLPAGRFIARLRPDVVWLQRPEQIVWGQTVARVSGTPLVVHLHHAPNYGRALPFLNRGVTLFIAVSQFMARRWASGGIDQARITVLHNAVSASMYPRGGGEELIAARGILGLAADIPVALYYGRLVEEKGVGIILDAWERLDLQPEQARLVLAGDWPPSEDAQLRGRIGVQVKKGTVTLLPNQGDVVPLLHAADVVLVPSLYDEAFGRVAVEALMTERPALASNSGAIPEILSGPLARLLVLRGDALSLAGGITELLDWRRTEPDLGRLCRLHAEARFSYDDRVVRLEDLLAAAAHAGRPRRSSSVSLIPQRTSEN